MPQKPRAENRRKKTRQANGEEYYHRLLLTTDTGYVMLDMTGAVVEANQAYLNLTGRSRMEEILGRSVIEWTAAHDRERNAREVEKCGETGVVKNLDIDYVQPDGSVHTIEIDASTIHTAGGERIVGLCRDITERRRIETRMAGLNRLKEELLPPHTLSDKLRLVVEAAVAIFDVDFARIWIVKPGDLCDEGCLHAQAETGRHSCSRRDRCLHLMASAGRYTHLDGRMHRRVPFGSYKIGRVASGEEAGFFTNDAQHDPRVHDHAWAKRLGLVAFAGYRLMSSSEVPIGVFALFSRHAIGGEEDALLKNIADTAAQLLQTAAAEEALRAKTEELDLYFMSSLDLLCIADSTGRFRRLNPEWERTLGYSLEELIGKHLLDFVHPDDEAGTIKAIGDLSEKREVLNFVNRYRCKDGSYRWIEWRAFPSGLLIYAVARDISGRKLVEEDLRYSESKYRGVFDASGDALIIMDGVTGDILDANAAATDLYGYGLEELCEMRGTDLSAAEGAPARDPSGESPPAAVHYHRKKSGEVFPVEITARPSFLAGRGVSIVDIRDITERQRHHEERLALERQIQQAQKLESLGVLAGGIAHDFNNFLTAIMGNIGLALSELPPNSPAGVVLEDAAKATRRAADLAKQMLAYSGKGRFIVASLDLREIIEEMTHMLRVSISKKAELRVSLAEKLPSIDADATQVRQIVMNLVINASEALGDKNGVITLCAGSRDCDPEYLAEPWNRETMPGGRYVHLEVTDTGCGIPSDQLPMIFDPFFTTKFAGRGLGLAAVLGIMRGHKGTIKIRSELGAGTTFTALFPASVRPFEKADQADTGGGAWRGSGLVLLVDDDESIRVLGKRILERLGFQVAIASDGRQALEVFRGRQDEIACVLLDLTMPQMDGEEVFRLMRELRGEVPVILSSGYDEQDVVSRFAGKGLSGFIQKPYSLANMQRVLEKATKAADKPAARPV